MFVSEFIDFVTSYKDILASKIIAVFEISVCMEKLSQELQRIFEIAGTFSCSAKYYFLQKVRYIQWNILNFELVSIKYSPSPQKNPSWFLFLNKSQVQKSVDVLTCFSCTVRKNKNSKASRPIVGPPPPLPMLSFSKCFVCLFCSFTSFLSVLIVFHWKNLVLLHQMNRYTLSTSE